MLAETTLEVVEERVFQSSNKGMHIEVETITPEVAKFMLSQNLDRNRPVKMDKVKWLAAQMKKPGQWRMDGMPIRFSDTGRLLDGQHRLQAIIDSNTTQSMLVVYGLDESTFTVMDTGTNRTAADTLHIAGFKDSSLAAATTRLILNYERTVASNQLRNQPKTPKLAATNQEILEFNETVDLSEYLARASKWYKHEKIYSKAEYAFFYWVFSHIDKEDSIVFLDGMATGANLSMESPIYLLRKRLMDWRNGNSFSLTAMERLCLTFKAWNLFRTKTTVKLLVFSFDKEGLIQPK